MIIQSGFFQQIYHIGSLFYYQQWIDIWRPEFKQETDGILFCLLIPETKAIKILQRLNSINHVEHNTCIAHGRNIKTRYVGLKLILQFGKDVYHAACILLCSARVLHGARVCRRKAGLTLSLWPFGSGCVGGSVKGWRSALLFQPARPWRRANLSRQNPVCLHRGRTGFCRSAEQRNFSSDKKK